MCRGIQPGRIEPGLRRDKQLAHGFEHAAVGRPHYVGVWRRKRAKIAEVNELRRGALRNGRQQLEVAAGETAYPRLDRRFGQCRFCELLVQLYRAQKDGRYEVFAPLEVIPQALEVEPDLRRDDCKRGVAQPVPVEQAAGGIQNLFAAIVKTRAPLGRTCFFRPFHQRCRCHQAYDSTPESSRLVERQHSSEDYCMSDSLNHRMLSQLSSFSLPSNSGSRLPPVALKRKSVTRSRGLVVALRRMSRCCSWCQVCETVASAPE